MSPGLSTIAWDYLADNDQASAMAAADFVKKYRKTSISVPPFYVRFSLNQTPESLTISRSGNRPSQKSLDNLIFNARTHTMPAIKFPHYQVGSEASIALFQPSEISCWAKLGTIRYVISATLNLPVYFQMLLSNAF